MSTRAIEAEMLERARRMVLGTGAYVPITAVPGAVDAVRDGRLFSIHADSVELIPRWAIKDDGEPVAGLAPVLKVLRPHRDDWGVAYWFDSCLASLGNTAPKTVLAKRPEDVLRAAQREIAEQLYPHG